MISTLFDFIKVLGTMTEKEQHEKRLASLFESLGKEIEALTNKNAEETSIEEVEKFVKTMQSIVSQMQSTIRKMKEWGL